MLANRDLIRQSFYLKNDVVYFNSGAFGVCPKPVLEEKIRLLYEFESNPVMGFSKTMFERVSEHVDELAKRIDTDSNNIALLANVSQGISSVLNSIDVGIGDEILLTNYTYSTVQMSVETIFSQKGGNIQQLILQPPFESNDHVTNLYVNFVKRHPKIKYAVIDHIPSDLAMVQPVDAITKALKQLGVFVIIDGAHAPGQLINLSIRNIDADVYIGTLHKWCFIPRGLGFIAVRSQCPIEIKPSIVSHLQNYGFTERFLFLGTQDITNMLCIKKAFEFIDNVGGFESVFTYNSDLLNRGIKYLEERWNVNSLKFPEVAPFMRSIPFPEGFDKYKHLIIEMKSKPFERTFFELINNRFGFNAALAIIDGSPYFRLCCHIFTEFDDFIKFSQRVFDWLKYFENSENS